MRVGSTEMEGGGLPSRLPFCTFKFVKGVVFPTLNYIGSKFLSYLGPIRKLDSDSDDKESLEKERNVT